MLAEIGDDRTGFATARDLQAYAGSSPIPRAWFPRWARSATATTTP
ncbi:hypothetical protein [Streptomyces macrosporus]